MDNLAQRYGYLPSEILERATTLDLQVLDIALSYEKMKRNKASGVPTPVSQDVMLEAIKNVRGG